MENRFGSIFLSRIILAGLISVPSTVLAEVPDPNQIQEVEAVIQPEVNRIEFDESKISVGDFEVIPGLGLLSIEDFGTNAVINVKLNYHMTEDLFLGFEVGRTKAGKSSIETLNAPLMSEDERIWTYYLFNIGYNVLPGEAYLSKSVTYNNAMYVIAGMGSVEFAGDNRLAISFGVLAFAGATVSCNDTD